MTPEGWRAAGRPKTAWRRTVEKERNKVGWKSWEVTKVVAQERKCWSNSMEALCAYWRNDTWWWWKVLTLDQIDQQSNEETCENERTEQVEKQICGGQTEILVEKKWEMRVGGGGGGEVKFYIIYCKWFRMNHLHFWLLNVTGACLVLQKTWPG